MFGTWSHFYLLPEEVQLEVETGIEVLKSHQNKVPRQPRKFMTKTLLFEIKAIHRRIARTNCQVYSEQVHVFLGGNHLITQVTYKQKLEKLKFFINEPFRCFKMMIVVYIG